MKITEKIKTFIFEILFLVSLIICCAYIYKKENKTYEIQNYRNLKFDVENVKEFQENLENQKDI